MNMADEFELKPETVGMPFQQFLCDIGCDKALLQKLEDEKIDAATILLMTDDDLKVFFPKIGDRLAVKNFCKKHAGHKKIGFIEKLKNRLKKPTQSNLESSSVVKNKRSMKSTRQIEIGWMHCDSTDQIFRQVRTVSGGGTRKLNISKHATGKEVLETAIDLFFPEGESPRGKASDFDMKLLDFKCNICQLNLTVQDMYAISALSMLRFYLGTSSKKEVLNQDINLGDIPKESSSVYENSRIAETVTRSTVSDPEWIPDSPLYFMPDSLAPETRQQQGTYNVRQYIGELDVEDTLTFEIDYGDITNVEATPIENTMVLRRGHILEDLLKAFEQNFLNSGFFKIEMILPSGERETAEDFGGVWRDALSDFWSTFYEKCTVGTMLKVPCIRHDFGDKEWRSVAKILHCGYTTEKYFPIQLAPVFVKYCFSINFNDQELTANFLNYISETDRKILEEAQNNFDSVTSDDIIDVFSSYDCKWAPTIHNLEQLIRDIAHQELIQKPAFIAKCIQQELGKKTEAIHEILNVYETLKPSVKNCLSKIILHNPENNNGDQSKVFNFLKKFIKETNDKTRESLFRFCTGSNLPTVTIKVDFTETSGVSRLPIGHTCSGLLMLSSTYESYVIFRNELKSVLSSNIWVMDIV